MRAFLCLTAILAAAATADDSRHRMDTWPGGGYFAQVVDSSEWRTTFQFTNADSRSVYVGVIFFDDLGQMLRLPIAGGTASSVGFTLEPNRTVILSTDGTGALKQGWATVMTCDLRCTDTGAKVIRANVAAAAILRQSVTGRQDAEAVVPIDVPDRPVLLLFDNRSGYGTGIALLNGNPLLAVSYTIRVVDNMGTVVGEETMQMPAMQKKVFVLADRFPNSAGKFGHVVVSGSSVVAMGLRFNPNGSFTSSHAMTFVPAQ